MNRILSSRVAASGFALAMLGAALIPQRASAWGDQGHTMAGRAAAARLPADMPEFFRSAGDQLGYLNPEPDRWRDSIENRADRALGGASAPEHYIDMELVSDSALRAPNRIAYANILHAAGGDAGKAGLAPWQVIELTQRLRSGFRLWRTTTDPRIRGYVEQRIINDAGVLGHYVTDLANPHHTSVHHNGWAEGYANPRGYTTDRRFHGRFESEFVRTHVTYGDLLPAVNSSPQVHRDLRPAVFAYVRRSHAELGSLYQLEQREPYGAATRSPEHKQFAVQRLAAGSEMLRDLWYTAWITSAPTAAQPRSE